EVRNPLLLSGFLGAVRTAVLKALPNGVEWGPMETEYKGVPIVRVQSRQDWAKPKEGMFRPALYYALTGGAFYVSLTEAAIKAQIDAAAAPSSGQKGAATAEAIPVNSSLYLSPGAIDQAGGVVRMALEREVRERALAN